MAGEIPGIACNKQHISLCHDCCRAICLSVMLCPLGDNLVGLVELLKNGRRGWDGNEEIITIDKEAKETRIGDEPCQLSDIEFQCGSTHQPFIDLVECI